MTAEEREMQKFVRFLEWLDECGIVLMECDYRGGAFRPVADTTNLIQTFVEDEAVYMNQALPY
jgi:hypothetical protein